MNRLDLVPGGLEDVFEGDEVLRDAAFGDIEDDAFRGIECLVRGRAVVEPERRDPSAGTDQLSLCGGLLHEVAVVLDVGRGRYATLQLREEHLATGSFEHQHLLEFGCERQQVDGIAAVVEVERRPVHLGVMVQIEVLGTQEVGDPHDRVAIEHQ